MSAEAGKATATFFNVRFAYSSHQILRPGLRSATQTSRESDLEIEAHELRWRRFSDARNVASFLPLIAGLIVLSAAFAFYEVSAEKRGLQQELDRQPELARRQMAAKVLVDAVEPAPSRGARSPTCGGNRPALFNTNGDRVLGIAIYDKLGKPAGGHPKGGGDGSRIGHLRRGTGPSTGHRQARSCGRHAAACVCRAAVSRPATSWGAGPGPGCERDRRAGRQGDPRHAVARRRAGDADCREPDGHSRQCRRPDPARGRVDSIGPCRQARAGVVALSGRSLSAARA